MEEWFAVTDRVGMNYLRSPSSHNLEAPLQSLAGFASLRGRGDEEEFTGPYLRPSLRLFNEHAISTHYCPVKNQIVAPFGGFFET
jgi:hypothetical protein